MQEYGELKFKKGRINGIDATFLFFDNYIYDSTSTMGTGSIMNEILMIADSLKNDTTQKNN